MNTMKNSKTNKTSSRLKNYTYAVGRRKSASARVRLFKGSGDNTVNGKNVTSLNNFIRPFKITETIGKYYFTAKVSGGGKEGQIEAIIHGISRAFVKLNPEKFRVVLKKNNLLTRDPRVRLRRMVGTGGKARRKKQSPKR